MQEILKKIGEPAALELLAEECMELAHAALKLARSKRGENPTPAVPEKCREMIFEEMADVSITMELIEKCPWMNKERVGYYFREHMKRFFERVREMNE